MELEHVGIAVRDAKSALLLMETLIGERPYKSETVEAEGVRTYFLRAGGVKLELLEALNEHSPIARHIGKRGPGLHHLAFEVDDLEATHDRLTKAGYNVLGAPRPGADGKRVFFVHPRETGGVLYEFCCHSRSTLVESQASVAGQRMGICRGGTRGPVALVVGKMPVPIESLVRRLEQSARIVVVDEPSNLTALLDALELDAVHLIAASGLLSKLDEIDPRVQSLIVVMDEPTDIPLPDRPTLLAARPSAAAVAAAVYERSSDCDLAVGSEDLLARAVETHIRRFDGT